MTRNPQTIAPGELAGSCAAHHGRAKDHFAGGDRCRPKAARRRAPARFVDAGTFLISRMSFPRVMRGDDAWRKNQDKGIREKFRRVLPRARKKFACCSWTWTACSPTATSGCFRARDGTASEIKGFSAYDGAGLKMARAAGLRTGVITGRESSAVTQRARECEIEFVYQRTRDEDWARYEEILRATGAERNGSRLCRR